MILQYYEFIYSLLNEILRVDNLQAVLHYLSPPSHWVQAIQIHHWLMSTYIAKSTHIHESFLPDSTSHMSHSGRRGDSFPSPQIKNPTR